VSLWFIVIFTACFTFVFSLHAEEEPVVDSLGGYRLEGVVSSDRPDGKGDVAIINGEFYNSGDHLGDYEVGEIHKSFVRLTHSETGEKSKLWVMGDPSAQEAKAVGGFDDEDFNKEELPENASPAMESLEKIKERIFSLPLFNFMWEGQAMANLRKLEIAARSFAAEEDRMPKDIPELIRSTHLSADFQSEVQGRYMFYFSSAREGLQLHADPENAHSTLKYFYIGPDGVLRFGLSGPADDKSPEV